MQSFQQRSRTSSTGTITRRTCTTRYAIRGHWTGLFWTAVREKRRQLSPTYYSLLAPRREHSVLNFHRISVDKLLMALDRFVSRRGLPQSLFR